MRRSDRVSGVVALGARFLGRIGTIVLEHVVLKIGDFVFKLVFDLALELVLERRFLVLEFVLHLVFHLFLVRLVEIDVLAFLEVTFFLEVLVVFL